MKIESYVLLLASGIFPFHIHRKNIDFTKSYIAIPTHRSYIEAATIYTSMPNVFKTLGKKELEKTPFYGRIFKAVCIAVDRSSLAARAMSVRKMKEELLQGVNVIIFPEGTFVNTPQATLLPFQDGAFTLAILQQTDLLPILFLDSDKRMHPSKIWKMSMGKNRTVFLPPISVQGLEKKDMPLLKEMIYNYMQACMDYCHTDDASKVWDFAINFLQKEKLLLH